MSIVLLLLLACFSYGVLLQPVECMPSPDPSLTDNGDNSNQLAAVVQNNRESLLKALLQMSYTKNFAQEQMNIQKIADIQCIIGPCDPITGIPLPRSTYPWPGVFPQKSKTSMSAIQNLMLDAALKQNLMSTNKIADTQHCVCIVSPCPCDQLFPAMIARSEKRDMQKHKRPAMRREKKRGNKVRCEKKKIANKVRHLKPQFKELTEKA